VAVAPILHISVTIVTQMCNIAGPLRWAGDGLAFESDGAHSVGMKPSAAVCCVAGLVLLCGCTQVNFTKATFRPNAAIAPPTAENAYEIGYRQGHNLVLEIVRKVTNYGQALDEFEDQLLVLQVKRIKLNERIEIPSADVTTHFVVTRFGPTSMGRSYRGYLIIREISDDIIKAYLLLDVTAGTRWETPPEKIRFKGNFVFVLQEMPLEP
jgi:hypothetical protein